MGHMNNNSVYMARKKRKTDKEMQWIETTLFSWFLSLSLSCYHKNIIHSLQMNILEIQLFAPIEKRRIDCHRLGQDANLFSMHFCVLYILCIVCVVDVRACVCVDLWAMFLSGHSSKFEMGIEPIQCAQAFKHNINTHSC